ncbi:MAG: TlpA family protein disulfide reductase, partial [Fimbriimonas sp.]
RADLDRFLKKTKFGNPVFHDSGTTWADWNVVAVPATFLIVDGRVVQQWVGRVKRETIDAAVVEGLAKLG